MKLTPVTEKHTLFGYQMQLPDGGADGGADGGVPRGARPPRPRRRSARRRRRRRMGPPPLPPPAPAAARRDAPRRDRRRRRRRRPPRPSRPRRRRCWRGCRPAWRRARRRAGAGRSPLRPGAGGPARRDRRGAARGRAGADRPDGAAAGGVAAAGRGRRACWSIRARPTSATCACASEAGRAGRGSVERDVLIGRATFVDPGQPREHRRLAARAGQPAVLPLQPRAATTRSASASARWRARSWPAGRVTIEDGRAGARRHCPQGIWLRDAGRRWARSDRAERRAGGRARGRAAPAAAAARAAAACWGRRAGRAAAAGSPPARDRRADRPAAVRADHHARSRAWW